MLYLVLRLHDISKCDNVAVRECPFCKIVCVHSKRRAHVSRFIAMELWCLYLTSFPPRSFRAPTKEEARIRVEHEYVEDQIQEAASDIRAEFQYENNMMER